jgi:hypothetical protein
MCRTAFIESSAMRIVSRVNSRKKEILRRVQAIKAQQETSRLLSQKEEAR